MLNINLGGIMLGSFGATELVIIFGIIILLFGVGRISKLGKEAGQAINAFKSGLEGEEEIVNE